MRNPTRSNVRGGSKSTCGKAGCASGDRCDREYRCKYKVHDRVPVFHLPSSSQIVAKAEIESAEHTNVWLGAIYVVKNSDVSTHIAIRVRCAPRGRLWSEHEQNAIDCLPDGLSHGRCAKKKCGRPWGRKDGRCEPGARKNTKHS